MENNIKTATFTSAPLSYERLEQIVEMQAKYIKSQDHKIEQAYFIYRRAVRKTTLSSAFMFFVRVLISKIKRK